MTGGRATVCCTPSPYWVPAHGWLEGYDETISIVSARRAISHRRRGARSPSDPATCRAAQRRRATRISTKALHGAACAHAERHARQPRARGCRTHVCVHSFEWCGGLAGRGAAAIPPLAVAQPPEGLPIASSAPARRAPCAAGRAPACGLGLDHETNTRNIILQDFFILSVSHVSSHSQAETQRMADGSAVSDCRLRPRYSFARSRY